MTSYRNYPGRLRMVRRALHMVRRHAWETGPRIEELRGTVVPAAPYCPACLHDPHAGEAGCHCGCRGLCPENSKRAPR